MSYLGWSECAQELEKIEATPLPGDGPVRRGVEHLFFGTLDGKHFEVALGYPVTVRVPIEPALDLGLFVQPQGVLPRSGPSTGYAAFDALCVIVADEPDRASRLVTRAIAEAYVALMQRSSVVVLRDDGVHVVGEGADWLRTAVARAVEIAHRIDDGRAALPVPAWLAAHRASLGRFATERFLAIDDTPIRLGGTTHGIRVQVVVNRILHEHFALDATITMPDSLNLELHVTPAGLLTPLAALWPGQADRRLGDPDFDKAFHVRTAVPETLARCLDTEAKKTLVHAAQRARSLVLDDRGLRFDLPLQPGVPAEPAELLRGGIGLLERLDAAIRRAPGSPRVGPFR